MSREIHSKLTRRERLIMDILYKLGKATAAEVLAALPDQPSYSTVRAQLRVLEEKGHVRHLEQGLRYIYAPTVPRESVRSSALKRVLDTFFEGSAEKVVAAVLDTQAARMTDEELNRLSELMEKARRRRQS
jgi:BlaI family transcriptional regulator, penicillinase repressor